jgi:hypothetical protein
MGEIGGDHGILCMLLIDIIESIKQDNIDPIKKNIMLSLIYMTVNAKLKMIIVVCIALVFFISSIVHLNILINNDDTDVFAAFIGRILFVIIDFSMALWLMYNVKREFDPASFIGLMIVHAVASPTNINTLVNSHRV